MKLYRFCSFDELSKLLRGEKIYNHTDHFNSGKGGSSSTGFCLTADEPREAWKYLRGIVTPGVCLEFDIPEENLIKSRGRYAGDMKETARGVEIIPLYRDEWSTTNLHPDWLKNIIPLESFVPREELQAARYFYAHGEEMMKEVKYEYAK